MNNEAMVFQQIEQSIEVKKGLLNQAGVLLQIADRITGALLNGNKVILFGNGGSAADAQHIACEFIGKLYRERGPLPAIALTDNMCALTAIANDYGYNSVFSRQLTGLVKKGDVVIGISTSGNSPNVLEAVVEARRCGAITVGFSGKEGKLKELADYALVVPSTDTPRIQEAHITAGHIICYLVEEAVFRSKHV